jgi:hypothetical protein
MPETFGGPKKRTRFDLLAQIGRRIEKVPNAAIRADRDLRLTAGLALKST